MTSILTPFWNGTTTANPPFRNFSSACSEHGYHHHSVLFAEIDGTDVVYQSDLDPPMRMPSENLKPFFRDELVDVILVVDDEPQRFNIRTKDGKIVEPWKLKSKMLRLGPGFFARDWMLYIGDKEFCHLDVKLWRQLRDASKSPG